MDPIPDHRVGLEHESPPRGGHQGRPTVEQPSPRHRRHQRHQFSSQGTGSSCYEGPADRGMEALGWIEKLPVVRRWELVTQAAAEGCPIVIDQESVAGDEQRPGACSQDGALARETARKPFVVLVGQEDEIERGDGRKSTHDGRRDPRLRVSIAGATEGDDLDAGSARCGPPRGRSLGSGHATRHRRRSAPSEAAIDPGSTRSGGPGTAPRRGSP